MYFIDDKHKGFYEERLKELKHEDCYIKSLTYLLSMSEETRKHFKEIYDIGRNEINIESIKEPWQTSSSISICRLAFNLFNGLASDNPETEEISSKYDVSSLFCNKNAKYYFDAIKLRYPQYLTHNE